MKRLHRAGDPYPVLVRADLIDDVGTLLRRHWGARRVALVTQSVIKRRHGERLSTGLARAGIDAVTLIVGAGEDKKTLRTVETLYDHLVRHKFSRDDAILAFGGGTVGDMAGFVAATYLRGVRYVQIPTTLLAQIDSAIGAKVGVNHSRGKNLIGAIYRPEGVYIDPSLLTTLPRRELRSGLFELLKYGFIGAPRLLRRFANDELSPGSSALGEAIADGARRKLDVVRVDEHETGLRRILNFGHTIGHGLEAASEYRLLRHGEAVGWGMIGAVRLATRRGRISETLAQKLEHTIRSVGPLPSLRAMKVKRIVAAVQRDKKRSQHGLRFILPVALGRVEIIENMPEAEIAWAVGSLGAT